MTALLEALTYALTHTNHIVNHLASILILRHHLSPLYIYPLDAIFSTISLFTNSTQPSKQKKETIT